MQSARVGVVEEDVLDNYTATGKRYRHSDSDGDSVCRDGRDGGFRDYRYMPMTTMGNVIQTIIWLGTSCPWENSSSLVNHEQTGGSGTTKAMPW